MDDAELGRRAQAGDGSVWADIYDRYADRLHDYCFTILRDRHEAEDALHDAFVTAASRIHQLRDPERLRPWIYSICRTTSLARARKRSRAVPTDEVAEMSPAHVDDLPAERNELQRIVWDAAGGLAERDRAVLDLHLRQGLVGRDLAEALGVSPHHAAVLLNRARDLVDRSLGALLVGRTGRDDCPELDALLTGWDGSLTPLVRKRVARHIDRCSTCGERRRRVVSPLALLAAAPLVPAPASLRDRILGDIQTISGSGGPPPRHRWMRRGLARALLGAAAAAVVVGAALGVLEGSGSTDLAATGGDDPTEAPAADEGPTTSITSTTATTASEVEAPATTSTPAPAAPVVLTLVTGAIDLGANGTGAPLVLRNDGASALEWQASPQLAGVAVAPGSGTLAPGQTVQLAVTFDRSGLAEGDHTGAVAVGARRGGAGGAYDTQTVPVTASVEHDPEVSGLSTDRPTIGWSEPALACPTRAVATVVDESPVTVVVHWRDAAGRSGQAAMTPTGGGSFGGDIPALTDAGFAPLTWWVVATDARGNTTRSGDRVLPAGSTPC